MSLTEVLVNKDGFLEVIYHGDQTGETVARLVEAIADKIRNIDGKVDYLIDMTDVGKSTVASRTAVVSNLKKLRIRRQAIFGGNAFVKRLINFMVLAINQGNKISYFDTRAEAETWLKKPFK